MTTTQPEKQQSRRRRGTNETTGGRLGCNPDLLNHEKYVYRYINDSTNRIAQKTQYDDWDLVPNAGEKEDSTDLGDKVSVVVGTNPDGSPMRAYLARKLKTYFDEDEAAKSKALDEQLADLRRGNDRNGGSQSDYIPSEGISMK